MSDEQDKLKISLEPPKLFGRKKKSDAGAGSSKPEAPPASTPRRPAAARKAAQDSPAPVEPEVVDEPTTETVDATPDHEPVAPPNTSDTPAVEPERATAGQSVTDREPVTESATEADAERTADSTLEPEREAVPEAADDTVVIPPATDQEPATALLETVTEDGPAALPEDPPVEREARSSSGTTVAGGSPTAAESPAADPSPAETAAAEPPAATTPSEPATTTPVAAAAAAAAKPPAPAKPAVSKPAASKPAAAKPSPATSRPKQSSVPTKRAVVVAQAPLIDIEREDAEIAEVAARQGAPILPTYPAAAVTGAVVGVAMVALTFLSLQGCEAVRGTSSCGGGPGFLLLIATFAISVLLGSALLKTFRVSDPGSSSFLAVGVVAVVALLFLINALDHWSMLIVIPLLSVGAYLGSVWITLTFVDQDDQPRAT